MADEEGGVYAKGEEHHWDDDIYPQSKRTHSREWEDLLGLDSLPDALIAIRYGGFVHWRYRKFEAIELGPNPGPLVAIHVHRRRFLLPIGGSIVLGKGRARVYTRKGEVAVDYRYSSEPT